MFKEIAPILNQCQNLTLSMTPHNNGDITVVMQSTLKALDENAPDSAKQLYAALAMPLVVTASEAELDTSFVDMLAEYCQQHTQSRSTLEQALDRVKENNKSARQTASADKTVSKAPIKPEKKENDVVEPAPVKTESVTTQTNPTSLF